VKSARRDVGIIAGVLHHVHARVHQSFTMKWCCVARTENRSQRISGSDSRKKPVLASGDETRSPSA
jgi:hypothetical protein